MSEVRGLADTIIWYDDNAVEYAKASKGLFIMPAVERFLSHVPPGGSILDAGCGSGRDTELFKSRGYVACGVDLSRGLLGKARQQHPEIEFVYGDLRQLPFDDASFDGVWAQASLLHFDAVEDVGKSTDEFYRVLKPGGVTHISVKQQFGKKMAIVSDQLSNHGRFFQYFSKDEMSGMVAKAGFEVLYADDFRPDPAGRDDTKWIWVGGRKKVAEIQE